jgi:dTDP-4-amino-4,6-dideoxygalactose transaminase
MPIDEADPGHVYHLFPVRCSTRDALQAHLAASGIETLIHYPVPLSRQRAFAAYDPAPTPVADRAALQILSLPLHPRLTSADVGRVAGAVAAFVKGRAFA